MSISADKIIYMTRHHPAWPHAIYDYLKNVQSAARHITWMKEKNWYGYDFHKHEFGVEGGDYKNLFEKADTCDKAKEQEIRIIQDFVPCILQKLGEALRAKDCLDRKMEGIVVDFLIQEACDCETGRVVELFSARLAGIFEYICLKSEEAPRFPIR